MIVYLLGKSPFEFRTIETFLDISESQSRAGTDVKIIFLHGGVLAGREGNRFQDRLRRLADAGATIHFRVEDLEARSIKERKLSDAGTQIDTIGIMRLAAQSDTIVSII